MVPSTFVTPWHCGNSYYRFQSAFPAHATKAYFFVLFIPMNLLDFQNSELTYCLLRNDFSIELDIPLDSLCPAVGLKMYSWSQRSGYESSSYLNVRLLI